MSFKILNYFLTGLLIFSGAPRHLSAQKTNYVVNSRFLGVEDGLASREVLCGLQDSKGFVWLGTREGLNRYDGKTFLLFTSSNSHLRADKILNIAEDQNQFLWILYGPSSSAVRSDHKLDVFNTSTYGAKSAGEVFKQLPFNESEVEMLIPSGQKIVFIILRNQDVWQYSKKAGFTKVFSHEHLDIPYWTAKVWCYDSTIAVAWPSQIMLKQGDSIYNLRPCNNVPVMFDSAGNCIVIPCNTKHNYKPAVILGGQLAEMEGSGITGHIASYRHDPISNTALLSRDDGVLIYNGKNLVMLMDSQTIDKHPDLQIYGHFRDQTGKYWLYTSTGVFIFKVEQNKFEHYFTTGQLSVQASNQARGIFADTSGNVYANTWNFLSIAHNKVPGTQKIDTKMLSYPLVAWNDSILYTLGYNIGEYNRHTNRFYKYAPHYEIWAAFFVGNKLLLSGAAGLDWFDTRGKKVIPATCKGSSFPAVGNLYRIFRGKDGRLWGAGVNGIYVISDEGCVIDYYGDSARDESHKLPLYGLNDAYEDTHGIFWLATSGRGLLRWDRKTDSLTRFTVSEGFSSNIMYRIEPDNHNNLWISTDYGLTRFNKIDYHLRTYTVKDGLSHNEFNRISSFTAADGRMYFGGIDGVNAFYPDDFAGDTLSLQVPLRLTSLAQFEESQNKLIDKSVALISSTGIILNPGDRFFNVVFNLLDYENEPHLYAYQIEGLDKQWNYISENSIRISGLPYGSFVLKIKGRNINGQWATGILSIPVLVLKPFYLRTWFIALCSLISILLIYTFVFIRTRQLEQDNVKLENTVASRTRELRQSLTEKEVLLKEIHHRVKNNLQTITSLLDLQGRGISDDAAKSAIQDGQNRVRSIALIHQNLYQNESLGNIEFSSFMNELTQSVKNVFLKTGSKFNFTNHIPETFLDIDTALPLGMIANELLTNSFKYGFSKDNSLHIDVYLKSSGNGVFIFELHDRGGGLPPEFNLHKAKGLGMRLVNRLSQQLHGKLNYRYDRGSSFEISFKDTQTRKLLD